MSFLTRSFNIKSFWFLLILGIILATGQMPFDIPYLAFSALVLLGYYWIKHQPKSFESFIWGFAFGFGYFGITFFWIVEPFLVESEKTGWLAPIALFFLVIFLSFILSLCFFLAAVVGHGRTKNQRLIIFFLFFLSSELARSELIFNFPWGLISSIWINTPFSQSLALFGPYWLSGLTILCAFLLSRVWVGTITALLIILALYVFGYYRLSLPLVERTNPVKIRIVQPNIQQSEKWKPELAATFLNRHISLSKSALETGVDLIVWPETSVSYEIMDNLKLRDGISSELRLSLLLGARRFDKENKKLFNSAFLLAENGDIIEIYDKIKLVPFGEYIPFGEFLSSLNILGLASDGLIGFSSGKENGIFKTKKLGVFKILICYEAIFSEDQKNWDKRPSWIINITNDAWFGAFSGPYQHLTLARMRAIESGLPMVRSANTGISAMIGPFGRILSQLNLETRGYIEEFLPKGSQPTLYSRLGPTFCNFLLTIVVLLTIVSLIFISLVNRYKSS